MGRRRDFIGAIRDGVGVIHFRCDADGFEDLSILRRGDSGTVNSVDVDMFRKRVRDGRYRALLKMVFGIPDELFSLHRIVET